MTRAKLTFEERIWLENALNNGYSKQKIFEKLGIDSYQLYKEKQLGGWSKKNPVYSASKAQLALK